MDKPQSKHRVIRALRSPRNYNSWLGLLSLLCVNLIFITNAEGNSPSPSDCFLGYSRVVEADPPRLSAISYGKAVTNNRDRSFSFDGLRDELESVTEKSRQYLMALEKNGFSNPLEREELFRELGILQERYKELQKVLQLTKDTLTRATRDSRIGTSAGKIEVLDGKVFVSIEVDGKIHRIEFQGAFEEGQPFGANDVFSSISRHQDLLDDLLAETNILQGLIRNHPEDTRVWRAVRSIKPAQMKLLFRRARTENPQLASWDPTQVDVNEFLGKILNARDQVRVRGHWAQGWTEYYDPVSGLGVHVGRGGEIEDVVVLTRERVRALPKQDIARTEGELHKAGSVWNGDDRIIRTDDGRLVRQWRPGAEWENLAELNDGAHVYLITTKGRVISSPRVPSLTADPDGEIFATHRALLEKLKERDPGAEILAAGEFHVMNGRIAQLNNRAGTFHGGPVQLHLAEQRLRERGLPIEEGTQRVDHSSLNELSTGSSSRPHEDVLDSTRTALEVARNATFQKNRDLIKELYKRLAAHQPNSKKPGYVDIEALMDVPPELSGDAKQAFLMELVLHPLMDSSGNVFRYLFNLIESDGFDYAARHLSDPEILKPFGANEFKDILAKGPDVFRFVQALRKKFGLPETMSDAEIDAIFSGLN